MKPEYYIRPFRMSDLDAVLLIERASFGADAYDRNLFAELFVKCGRLFLVAAARTGISAYMVTSTALGRATPSAELVSVAVGPACRGQGIASSLMRSTLRRLRLRRVRQFTLAVRASNRQAQALYAKFGFARLRQIRRYYEDGEDALVLRKLL
ncbi:MAG: ribosomal protein S18-alanine N-acetyltransferase [Bryobacteraceae bacterium]|jgi:ribosomal-protein-alanine N-acetyltransferase